MPRNAQILVLTRSFDLGKNVPRLALTKEVNFADLPTLKKRLNKRFKHTTKHGKFSWINGNHRNAKIVCVHVFINLFVDEGDCFIFCGESIIHKLYPFYMLTYL